MEENGYYICDSCGEEIEVSLDPSAGNDQEYVEDCPVCCVPNLLRINWDDEGRVSIQAQRE
jgi:hypothetical protein